MSDGFDNFKESLRNAVAARLDNPFVFGFITSWVAINWEYLYVTFFVDVSGQKRTKIEYLWSLPYEPADMFVWPAVWGAVVTIGYPVVGALFSLPVGWIRQARLRAERGFLKNRVYDSTEYEELEKKNSRLELKHAQARSERDSLQQQADTLRQNLGVAKDQLERAREGAQELQGQAQRLQEENSQVAAERGEARHQVEVLTQKLARMKQDSEASADFAVNVLSAGNPFEVLFPGTWRKSWPNALGMDDEPDVYEDAHVTGDEYVARSQVYGGTRTWTLSRIRVQKVGVVYFEQHSRQEKRSCHVAVSLTSKNQYNGFEWFVDGGGRLTQYPVQYEHLVDDKDVIVEGRKANR